MYQKHSDIPFIIKEYILTISGCADITVLSLVEINEFLSGLEEFYALQPEVEVDEKSAYQLCNISN